MHFSVLFFFFIFQLNIKLSMGFPHRIVGFHPFFIPGLLHYHSFCSFRDQKYIKFAQMILCFYFAFVSICVSFLLCLSSNLVECILLHQHVVPFKYSSHSFALFSLIRNMIDGSHFPFCCKSNTSEYLIRFTLFTIFLNNIRFISTCSLKHRRDVRLDVLRDLNFLKT